MRPATEKPLLWLLRATCPKLGREPDVSGREQFAGFSRFNFGLQEVVEEERENASTSALGRAGRARYRWRRLSDWSSALKQKIAR